MSVKKSFLILPILSTIILITSIYSTAEAARRPYNKLSEEEKNRIDGTGDYSVVFRQEDSNPVYDISGILAGSAEGFVYRYYGGTDWRIVSPDLGGSVLCLAEYQNAIYAGTRDGKVWKTVFSPGTGYIWTEVMFPSGQEPYQVNALVEYRNELYAGTSPPKLFRLSGNDQWEFVTTATRFYGIRCLYAYQDILFLGDILEDYFGHYDGNVYVYDGYYGVSCIWDFQEYHNRLYAGSYAGDVYRIQEPLPDSSEKFTWEKIRYPDGYDTWELETFQDLLYVSHGRELLRYDGNNFSGPVVVIPDENQIIAMLTCDDGENLLIGVGQEMGAEGGAGTEGRAYFYDGTDLISISEVIGVGIQCFLDRALVELSKVDDVNDGDCRGPGDEINYTIDYNYPGGPNWPDINDVNIIDYLPDEVDFNSASGPNCVQPDSNTVIWHIGTLHPGDSGSVTLKVNVKCAQPGGRIINVCEIKSGSDPYNTAYTFRTVCSRNTDFNEDCIVNFMDFAVLALHWLEDNTIPPIPQSPLVLDTFESYTATGGTGQVGTLLGPRVGGVPDSWRELGWTYGTWWRGSSTLTLLTTPAEANDGNNAMRWVYDVNVNFPDTNIVRYTEILVVLANEVNLGVYWDGSGTSGNLPRSPYTAIDQIRVMLKRHTGNSPEYDTFMYAKFLNDIYGTYDMGGIDPAGPDKYDIAKEYIGGNTADPNDEYYAWTINLDSVEEAWTWNHQDLEHVGAIIFGIRTQPVGPYGLGQGTIDVDDIYLVDLPGCDPPPVGDLNDDCRVNFEDVKIFVLYWLDGK